jgi:hypothetical protein
MSQFKHLHHFVYALEHTGDEGRKENDAEHRYRHRNDAEHGPSEIAENVPKGDGDDYPQTALSITIDHKTLLLCFLHTEPRISGSEPQSLCSELRRSRSEL